MESLVKFLIEAFFVFRISNMITAERGPFDIFLRFSNLFLEDDWIGDGIRCLYCVSFWIGLLVAFIHFGFSWEVLIYGPALSGAAILVHKL